MKALKRMGILISRIRSWGSQKLSFLFRILKLCTLSLSLIAVGSIALRRKPLYLNGINMAILAINAGRFKKRPEEKRADIEGAYGTGCHTCVGEFAHYRENENEAPYLSRLELRRIALDLQDKGLICDYHKQNAEQRRYHREAKNISDLLSFGAK